MKLPQIRRNKEPEVRQCWKDVLLAFYNDELIGWEWDWDEPNITDNHPLAKKLKISGKELARSLNVLENHELIVKAGSKMEKRSLTDKGFDVAVKVEAHRETFAYRVVSLYLSLILAIILLLTLMHQVHQLTPIIFTILSIVGIVSAAFVVLRMAKKP